MFSMICSSNDSHSWFQALEIVKQAKVAQILGASSEGDKRRQSSSSSVKDKHSRRGSRESIDSMQYDGDEVSLEIIILILNMSF